MQNTNQKKSKLIVEKNPYAEPILKFINEIKDTAWAFPFVPQVVNTIVIIFILLILCLLYITIGIISQISSTFWSLIVQTGQKIVSDNPVQSSAYAIAIGVYFILFLPPFLIQFPFWLIGYIISKVGFAAFLWIIAILSLIIISLYLTTDLQITITDYLNPADSTHIDSLSVE